jgi:circadian clock protein KaiB
VEWVRLTKTDSSSLVGEPWQLRLYVAGEMARSMAALSALRRICEARLPGRHHIDVFDLLAEPELGRNDGIQAVPTLIRTMPTPTLRIVGDLSSAESVLFGIERMQRG